MGAYGPRPVKLPLSLFSSLNTYPPIFYRQERKKRKQRKLTARWNYSFVSQSRGENNYFGEEQIPRAIEACKSNALMRCCKDLGVAAELWDRRFVRAFKEAHAQEVWVEHVTTKKKAKIWLRKEDKVEYPFKIAQPVKR